MIFLNQMLLWGALAGAIPIVLHLMNRRRAKVIDFSSLMFLRLIDMRFVKRRKLKELLLLATRVLLLVLLALALAKPVIRTSRAQAASAAATTACIVLDNSMSMSLVHSGSDSFSLAVDAARRILDTLRNPGDSAALVLSVPAGAGPVAPSRVNITRSKLDTASVTCQAGSMADALRKAAKFLENAATPAKELHIITDLQKSSWDFTVEENLFGRVAGSFSAYLVDVGADDAGNVGITDIETAGGAAVSNRPVEIRAVVRNFSPEGVSGSATLFVQGTPAGEAPYRLNAGQAETLTFTFTPTSPAALACAVEIGGDALARDNRRDFHLDVLSAVKVALVDGDPHDVPYLDECFYLLAALDPLRSSDKGGTGIEPKTLSVASLPQTSFADFDVVILANVAEISPETLERLEAFVQNGGGLMWFGGDAVEPVAAAGPLLGDIFPHTPVGIWRAPEPTRWTHVNWLAENSRILGPFTSQKGFDLSTAHYTAYVRFDEMRFDRATRVVAAFANKDPAIMERPYGNGRAVVFASSGDLDWNNFAVKPLFLPVLHRYVHELAAAPNASSAVLAGSPWRFERPREDSPERITVFRPDGGWSHVELVPKGDAVVATYADTHMPGIYRAAWETQTGGEETFFAVYPNPNESDCARLATAELAENFKAADLRVLEPAGNIAAQVTRLREGIHLWLPLLAMVTMLLVVEGLLANPLDFLGRRGEKL